MKAMILKAPGKPLELIESTIPQPEPFQVQVKVKACGVCRTDLHIADGELTEPRLPLVMGHQIVGEVSKVGDKVKKFKKGDRIGIPWLGKTCGKCNYCKTGKENLCENPEFTGYTINGGYAEYTVADESFCFPIPENYPALQAAPLLCAGLIGYRSFSMVKDADRIGFYGFGAAAHIIIQVAVYLGRKVYAFTRPVDKKGQKFAIQLGATWAGDSLTSPPEPLDAAIIFAPVGDLVPVALQNLVRGGKVICAGIHMSDIPSFPYNILWHERCIQSVANLTRKDGEEFLRLAPVVPVHTEVTTFPLEKANEALKALRDGRLKGAGVLVLT